MKKILVIIAIFSFISCERPQRFDFDEFLGTPDDDSEVQDFDMDAGDTGNTGNSGDTGNTGNDVDEQNDLDCTDVDTDIDQPDEDNEPEPFCGNGKIDEGELCDKGTESCLTVGVGTEGNAKCSDDCKSWITAGNCTQKFTCSSKPANSVWNEVSEYEQTWDGEKWVPSDTVTAYNTKPSETECRYKCALNYSWEVSECVADKRENQICIGIPDNAVWNTVSNITQTWNGTDWMPSTTGIHNTVASTTECRYKCKENYLWNGSQCSACGGNFPNWHKDKCWSDRSANAMTWSNAITYCEGLGGRLPNIQELRMLIKECPKNEYPKPAGQDPWCEVEDPGNLGGSSCTECGSDSSGKYSIFGEIHLLWSSSLNVSNVSNAWHVFFRVAEVHNSSKAQGFYARCVR